MKSFLRENPAIAFGLGLPLLLVVLCLLLSWLPSLLVAPPHYDVLYATEYYNYPNGIHISVVNQKVQVFYQGKAKQIRPPRLWRYDHKTGGVKEISFVLPPSLLSTEKKPSPEDVVKITPIDVPDLEGLTVDSTSVAPDGYEFKIGRNRYPKSLFGGLFYTSYYSQETVLTKNGRKIRLPNASGGYYNNNIHFIGWVISQ